MSKFEKAAQKSGELFGVIDSLESPESKKIIAERAVDLYNDYKNQYARRINYYNKSVSIGNHLFDFLTQFKINSKYKGNVRRLIIAFKVIILFITVLGALLFIAGLMKISVFDFMTILFAVFIIVFIGIIKKYIF